VGKGKRAKTRTIEAEPVAERHGFESGGLLGHDSTYAVNVTEQIALAVDTVFACVRTIADLTADANVGEFRGSERLDDSRLTRRPMATITRRTWLWMVSATMALYNGVWLWNRYGDAGDGSALSLVPVAPSRVNWTGARVVFVDGQKADPDSLRWVPRMTFPTVTPELGTLLRLARTAIASAWAADSYRADFWEAGGAPVIHLTTDQVITKDKAVEISDAWADRRTTAPGKPAVTGQGITVATLGADMGAEAATVAAGASGVSIARYFGVPAWLVNVPTQAGSLTYANAAAAGLDLVRYTLQPGYAGPIGDAWSDELPGDYLTGRRVVLDLAHLTRGTALEQAQAYAIATGGQAWMLPFEVRAELHMPTDMSLAPDGAAAPAIESIPTEA
jgi:phage portal protein BeeE